MIDKEGMMYAQNFHLKKYEQKLNSNNKPNGYSSRNNSLERYNRTIKNIHTKRYKLSMHVACEVFKTLVEYESKKLAIIATESWVTKKDQNKVLKYVFENKCFTI